MHGVTAQLVESAVNSLNDKLERLGWVRKYRFVKGSNANGVQHVLETDMPDLAHPAHREQIGRTLAEAHAYVLAMCHALNDAIAERERQRSTVRMDPVNRSLFADPDARSVRRAGQEV